MPVWRWPGLRGRGLYWAGSVLARIIREDEGHEGEGEVWEPSPPLTLPLPGGERRRGEGHLSRVG